jgi:hypothetical protein
MTMSKRPPLARTLAAAIFGFATVATAGCTLTTSDPVPVIETTLPGPGQSGSGSLRVDWTINGTTDAFACTQSGVAVIEILVSTGDGAVPAVYQQDCRSFATSIALFPGTYAGSAQLLDGANETRTTNVTLEPFTIRPNEELRVPIDFPSSSFF